MCDVILSRLIVTPFDRPDCQDVVCFTTARKRSLGARQCFYTCVSFCSRGGVCIQGESASRGSASRGRGLHGGGQIPPRILWDTANEWAVGILQEYILVS